MLMKKHMARFLALILPLLLLLQALCICLPITAAEEEASPANIAQGKLVTATSAFNFPVWGWAPEGLTDGTTSYGWHDGVGAKPEHDITANAPVDLTIDLQGTYTITVIKLFVSDAYVGWGGLPLTYDLQVSTNGKDWETVASEAKASITSGSLDYEFEAVETSYIRVHITEDSTKNGPWTAIGELEAWGIPKPEKKDPIYDWPTPTFADMETVPADTVAGTLKYTPSADGATVTISYELDGQPVSYTVPNQNNYLFGGYAGVDDLGRALYDSNDENVGTVKVEQERYVGLFYFLWHGAHETHGTDGTARNLQAILDGTSKVGYSINGEMHWFAEPLYGYYFANDTWVLRKHAELLTNAGVDFLYFDVTNTHTYSSTALKLMKILHELNEQGYDAPGVVFYTNSAAVERIEQIYTDIYAKNMYPDTWFYIDGKPVVVAPNIHDDTLPDGKKIVDFFTVKSGNWPNKENGSEIENNFEPDNNCWPWMDWHWPQKVYTDANGESGAINVSISQHSGDGNCGSSTLKGYQFNRGRSFTSNGQTSDDIEYNASDTAFNRELVRSYRKAMNDPTLSYQGLNFQEQFDYAIASNAKFILVTGWNEWVAQNGGTPENPRFIDTASIEFSRDSEMMRGGYFDNYYMQLIQNIQRVKGTAPMIVQDGRKPINVTGDFDQWTDIPVTYTDPAGDTADRNHRGYGEDGYTTYINKSGRNDIVATKVVSDTKNLYFYIETAENISKYDAESSWMQVYLNTDRDVSTGWYGYDYIVNYKAKGDFETTIAKYSGTDGAYGFTEAGAVAYRAKGNQMMMAIPKELLGIEKGAAIELEFKVADSRTIYDEMEDFYCDGDAAPLGRLNYIYCNSTSEAESETELDTTPATTTAVDNSPSADVPETDASDDAGCASQAEPLSVLLGTLPAAALLLRRKKKRI